MLVFRREYGFAINQGGTAGIITRPLQLTVEDEFFVSQKERKKDYELLSNNQRSRNHFKYR